MTELLNKIFLRCNYFYRMRKNGRWSDTEVHLHKWHSWETGWHLEIVWTRNFLISLLTWFNGFQIWLILGTTLANKIISLQLFFAVVNFDYPLLSYYRCMLLSAVCHFSFMSPPFDSFFSVMRYTTVPPVFDHPANKTVEDGFIR